MYCQQTPARCPWPMYLRAWSKPWRHIVTYFAILPPAGAKVADLEEIDINWPLAFVPLDSVDDSLSCRCWPHSSCSVQILPWDTNEGNYLVDVDEKVLWMIDFGRSYFRWTDKAGAHYITPRKDFQRPQNCTKDILTFYRVIQQLLKLPNKAALSTEDMKVRKGLATFFSKATVNPHSELTRFADWCAQIGIDINVVWSPLSWAKKLIQRS